MLRILQYAFIYPALYLFSLLPFWFIYLCSNFLYLIGFKLFKYRVSLVKSNLTLAFPEKSKKEINLILHQFYRNFFDIILEIVKLLTISKSSIRKRMPKGDMHLIESYYKKNKSIILAIGHFGNWELGALSYMIEDYPNVKGIYKPINSKFFNELMIKIRTRFGGGVYPMDEVLLRMRKNSGNLTAIALLSDQKPTAKKTYWCKFLGRDTPFFISIEMMAKRFNFPVVYLKIDRLGRGKYELSAELITETPRETGKFHITNQYIKLLERDIKKEPSNWLWSHNRWKRNKNVEESY